MANNSRGRMLICQGDPEPINEVRRRLRGGGGLPFALLVGLAPGGKLLVIDEDDGLLFTSMHRCPRRSFNR
jgi:hypothetical protein